MADSANICSAVVSVLSNDSTLSALMPGGVFVDVAPAGKTQFVIVSVVIHEDENGFDGRLFERVTYLVKAVDQNTSPATANTAAARIDELLQDVTLTIVGYSHLATRRIEYVPYTEIDETNKDIRWQHRGGRYEIVVSPEPGSP